MTDELGPKTYIGYRLLPAAVGLLDPDDDPRMAAAIDVFAEEESDVGYGARIDWSALAALQLSSTVRLRVDMARSLLDGDPVALSRIASFDAGTYALMMRALATCWPDPPPGIDELLGWQG